MERLSTTPFGARPVSAGLLATRALAEAEAPVAKFDKWELFRDLCTARKVFGVSDRDLSVLNALLTFHPQRALEDGQPLIVFPSNVSLSERAHGMAESTLRRHLAALVGAGLITRHDSPNGKRYASRDATGALVRAFGFDLRPLLVRAVEISDAAEKARQQTARIRRVREEITLLLRDALKLIAYGQEAMPGSAWDALEERALDARRVQRRQLDLADLEDLHGLLDALLREIECVLSDGLPTNSGKMDGNHNRTERHYQNSKPKPNEFELSCEQQQDAGDVPSRDRGDVPRLPLGLVLKACPEIRLYAAGEIRDWVDLVAAASFVHGMMGISPDAWSCARSEMGDGEAAIVVACMLERSEVIASPGGYLRALTEKSARGAFSPGPMVMALLSRQEGRAA